MMGLPYAEESIMTC